MDGVLLDLVDIQSVQVLRGPQGTLFGKNTTGGAIVFTTNKPVDEFEDLYFAVLEKNGSHSLNRMAA